MTSLPYRFSAQHEFEKPNDGRALDLMNAAATAVIKELSDICCAYGASDEFRYGVRKSLDALYVLIGQFCLRSIHYIVWSKREVSFLAARYTEDEWLFTALAPSSKVLTTVVSIFTSYYVHLWSSHFPETTLTYPLPSFDGRLVLYPSWRNLRDYLSWRQVDCETDTQQCLSDAEG